jgi:hypothetical protein
MTEKYGKPEPNSDHNIWKLNQNEFCFLLTAFVLADSSGVILDCLGEIKEPTAICKAFVSDKDAINMMRCGLVGGNPGDVLVTITEIIWINP